MGSDWTAEHGYGVRRESTVKHAQSFLRTKRHAGTGIGTDASGLERGAALRGVTLASGCPVGAEPGGVGRSKWPLHTIQGNSIPSERPFSMNSWLEHLSSLFWTQHRP
jgi:hypothetical protein